MRRFFVCLMICSACGSSDPSNSGSTDTGDSNNNGSSFGRTCTITTAGVTTCMDYTGSKYIQNDIQSACSAFHGTYGSSGCAKTDISGSCVATPNADNSYAVTYYFPSSMTLEEARTSCTIMSGTFTAGTKAACTATAGTAVLDGQNEQRTRYQAATAAVGQSCQSETQTRACHNGAWDTWSGTYQEEACAVSAGSCQGQATACTALADSLSCYSQLGCDGWQSAGCAATEASFAYNCSNWTYYANAEQVCNGIPGCYWLGSSCGGGVQYCEYKSSTECSSLASQGFYCEWAAAQCTGTVTACSSLLTSDTCAMQSGCSWQ